MTPEEKALSLCQSFAWTTVCEDANEGFSLPIEVAKKCALISVNEILKSMEGKDQSYLEKTYWHPIDYWQQVKQEIELL